MLHCGFPTSLWSADELPLVLARVPECFFWLHAGYRLKEVLLEYYDESFVRFGRENGFHSRSDGPDSLPHRLRLTREEARVCPGSKVAMIFAHVTPRFFFREGEQQVLQRALMGQTDEEIAASLGVGLATVKKRWIAAYERVSEEMPDLLPGAALDDMHPERKRGQEKRRRLLAYLGQHPEELRPVAPAGRSRPPLAPRRSP